MNPLFVFRTNFCAVCGDGIVTGTEQCDGGSFCTDKCKCVDGYKPTSSVSVSCEMIPSEFVPRVNPSLDCLDVLDNSTVKLYLSYDNLDGFEQTIPYGKYNSFIPSNFGVSFTVTPLTRVILKLTSFVPFRLRDLHCSLLARA